MGTLFEITVVDTEQQKSSLFGTHLYALLGFTPDLLFKSSVVNTFFQLGVVKHG